MTKKVKNKKRKSRHKTVRTVTVHPIRKRTILAVVGTGSSRLHDIYKAVDTKTKVKFVKELADLYTPASAIILLGGSDISPAWYGGEFNGYSHITDPKRDYLEHRLVKRAQEQGLPLFGICRGHQMITAQYGGTLWQDLRQDEVSANHPSSHLVEYYIEPIVHNVPTDHVNSYHHQATNKIPAGFELGAVSDDGVIEAIYKPGVLGVQWHPELMFPVDAQWGSLFEWHLSGLKADYKVWDKPLNGMAPNEEEPEAIVDIRQQRNLTARKVRTATAADPFQRPARISDWALDDYAEWYEMGGRDQL